jgi:uncharacterized LabA/DUF88 family protein
VKKLKSQLPAESDGAVQAVARAALYVDGFNLYHPIAQMGAADNHLKWACLWKLGEAICQKGGQQLERVVFCTAVPKVERDAGKHDRHIRFNSAQKARGASIILGHYVPEEIEENGSPTGRTKWVEKQTDINVALSLLFDGLDDLYDVAFLLSADTDQVATARVFSERLAPLGKQMVGVAPPGRKVPTGYSQFGIKGLTLSKYQLECCVMPEEIQGPEKIIRRPAEYAPPADWTHPENRPKGKPPKAPKVWGKGIKG